MPLREDEQRSWKRRIVRDALVRIGRIPEPPVDEVRAPVPEVRYRNRVEFSVGPDRSGSRVLGLHPSGNPDEWVDVAACLLQSVEADAVLGTIREFILRGAGAEDPVWDPTDEPVRITIRWSRPTERIGVVLRPPADLPPSARELGRRLLDVHPTVQSVIWVSGTPGRRGAARSSLIAGEDRIEDVVGGVRVPVPPHAFTQVSETGSAELIDLVVEDAGSPTTVIELFGGMGAFAFPLAEGGAEVVVVEADRSAVEAGRRAAELCGLADRVTFRRERVERFIRALVPSARRPDVIVADPPRAGLGVDLARKMAALGIDRVVLVSCDPGTLARDARVFVEDGYRLDRVVPVDLFPQTPHVETVARFVRK